MKAKVLHIISQNTKEPAILFKFYYSTSYCTSNKGYIFARQATMIKGSVLKTFDETFDGDTQYDRFTPRLHRA